MSKVDRDTVRHVARLAYLEKPRVRGSDGQLAEPEEPLLSNEAVDRLTEELGNILAHVEQLRELDLEGVPPTSHGVPLPPLLRDDEAGGQLDTERALELAPRRGGDAFSVPKIIE